MISLKKFTNSQIHPQSSPWTLLLQVLWNKLATDFQDRASEYAIDATAAISVPVAAIDGGSRNETDPAEAHAYDLQDSLILGDRLQSTLFKNGVGFKCLLAGASMALISGLCGVADRFACITEKRKERLDEMGVFGCHDDGVGYTGRFAAALSAFSWIIMLAAIATHSWVDTDKYDTDKNHKIVYCPFALI